MQCSLQKLGFLQFTEDSFVSTKEKQDGKSKVREVVNLQKIATLYAQDLAGQEMLHTFVLACSSKSNWHIEIL